jgi:hypothetical protein
VGDHVGDTGSASLAVARAAEAKELTSGGYSHGREEKPKTSRKYALCGM